MAAFQDNAVFWVEVDKIKPNPFQPRKEFDPDRLNDLADSIRQYGVLQPLVVTRKEIIDDERGITVEYELIAGERRHRASKLAGVSQVPVLIRSGAENDKLKLELAIIENLQREDLNPIDRARAFKQLAEQFGFKHTEIAKKVGKSREYVSNSIRLLALPEEILAAVADGRLSEGHARPILMLNDRPQEQQTLFKEVIIKKITVREAEGIARKIAHDKVRKKAYKSDPVMRDFEEKLSESFGTRVQIEQGDVGGKIVINFFSNDDLESILKVVTSDATMTRRGVGLLLDRYIERTQTNASAPESDTPSSDQPVSAEEPSVIAAGSVSVEETISLPETEPQVVEEQAIAQVDIAPAEPAVTKPDPVPPQNDEGDLYSIANFTV